MRLKVLICHRELVFLWTKREPVGAEPVSLLSWEGGCSLGGLQCIRRRWWRTWPPPPRLEWQLGRQGTCPALCLAGREEKKTASIYMSAFFSSLHPCISCFFPSSALWLLLSYQFIFWGLCRIQNHWNESGLICFVGIYCRLQIKYRNDTS